jgi:hypothetical protein
LVWLAWMLAELVTLPVEPLPTEITSMPVPPRML